MIPLKDNIPSRHFPIINYLLIIGNFLVFFYELNLGPQLESFFRIWAIVPARFYLAPLEIKTYLVLITSLFLHASWWHIIGNMLFLWIFGDNVEDKVGHFRYLIFYLICGVIAGLAHIFTSLHSPIPTVGASGAIAGVLGAYFLLFPSARVLTLIPIFFFWRIVEIPAFFFLGLWFVYQFLYGTASLGRANMGGVAWWAHIGGFIGGMILVKLFKKGRGK